jgi:hypothetical protein
VTLGLAPNLAFISMAQPETIEVGYHIIDSVKAPQFVGRFNNIVVPEGTSLYDLFNLIKHRGDPRLERADAQQVGTWILTPPVKFPVPEKTRRRLASLLRFCEEAISPDETAGEEVHICQQVLLTFKIRRGEVEWSDEKLCVLFEVSDGE